MRLFDLPLRVGGKDDWDDHVEIDLMDASGQIVATVYGTDALAEARAAWLVLQANAHPVTVHGLPADNELDEQAYQQAKDEVTDQ